MRVHLKVLFPFTSNWEAKELEATMDQVKSVFSVTLVLFSSSVHADLSLSLSCSLKMCRVLGIYVGRRGVFRPLSSVRL